MGEGSGRIRGEGSWEASNNGRGAIGRARDGVSFDFVGVVARICASKSGSIHAEERLRDFGFSSGMAEEDPTEEAAGRSSAVDDDS